ncbi:MAG: hypothetical protein Q7T59_04415 [Candidatus Woesebacteria bacterium]|nr:hypothetical protein [Candidatus Woesebacteria bacterium]
MMLSKSLEKEVKNMWFVTWNRPEYKEWAHIVKGGYQLVILRVEKDGRLLCVKARLNMKAKRLPEFVIEEEKHVSAIKDSQKAISEWKKE